jgi:hypothetical protein
MSQTTAQKPGLYPRLAAITAAVGWVAEDGKHFQGYRYASKDAILAALKPLLQQYPIAIIPRVVKREDIEAGQSRQGNPITLTRIEVEYTLVDPETGEVATIPWWGEALDGEGKGLTKALAAALKTFVINLFQIPCGDEEEPEPSRPPHRQQEPGDSRRSRPSGRQAQEPGRQAQSPKPEAANGNGNGREKLLAHLDGFVSRAQEAGLFTDAYPVPDFREWTDDQVKAYGARLRDLLQEDELLATEGGRQVIRDRLTIVHPQEPA